MQTLPLISTKHDLAGGVVVPEGGVSGGVPEAGSGGSTNVHMIVSENLTKE